MPLVDTLHTVAELAVAFAGFASLVSIIGTRRGRDAPHVDAARIRSMLESSLLVAAFAFVPILMRESGLSLSASWRTSAGIFAISVASIIALQTHRTYRATRDGFRVTGWWVATVSLLWLVTLGSLLSTTAGLVKSASFGYGLGLVAFLVYAGLLFIRLIASLLDGSESG